MNLLQMAGYTLQREQKVGIYIELLRYLWKLCLISLSIGARSCQQRVVKFGKDIPGIFAGHHYF